MKKLLTLLLVLLLSVGLAMPALAFTSDTSEEEDHPYDLSIYLVEYEDNDLFGFATLPPSDRGYAKNEIVAAVVELYVPEDEEITHAEHGYLLFGGENVDLDVTDNYDEHGALILKTSSNINAGLVSIPSSWYAPFNEDDIVTLINHLPGDETYKWLFFAKVTGDDASLYAKLKDGTIPDIDFELSPTGIPVTLDGIVYSISKTINFDGNGNIRYTVSIGSGSDYENDFIWIDVDEDYVSQGMTLFTGGSNPGNNPGIMGVNTDGELGVADFAQPAVLKTSGDLYDDVMDFYNDVVVDVFGMDYMLIGNYVRDSFFEDLVSGDTIIATVDIKPWTPYVTVPDVVVVDPPKTGDAASLIGFVMVALAGSGASVLFKKRG